MSCTKVFKAIENIKSKKRENLNGLIIFMI
jgi:hypothetical protein